MRTIRDKKHLGVTLFIFFFFAGGCKTGEKNLYEQAERLWERKMYALAAQNYEQFARQSPREHPQKAQSLYKAGFIYAYYLLDYPRSIQLFHRLIAIYPNRVETLKGYHHLAEIYENRLKQYDLAIAQYKNIINAKKDTPSDFPEYYYYIGRCYWSMGDWQKAINTYKKIIREFPQQAYADRAAYQIGYLHFLQGQYQESEKAFQFFLGNYPDSEWTFEGMYHLAACYDKRNLVDEANQIKKEMKKKFPER